MDRPMVYLITGANRGIGRALVSELLTRPSTIVIATVRDPTHSTAASLPSLLRADGSKLFVIPLDDANKECDYSMLEQRLHGLNVDYIDVVVANAGNSAGFQSVLDTDPAVLKADFDVNAVGVLKLFQSCWPRLSKSNAADERCKKFILISSTVGSIGVLEEEGFPSTAYGMSKVAANWLCKKISLEFKDEGLKVGIVHPGWVKTAMGQALADTVGVSEPPMTVPESSKQVLNQIDNLSMNTTSGKFISYDGKEILW